MQVSCFWARLIGRSICGSLCRLLSRSSPSGLDRACDRDAGWAAVFGIALGYEDLNDHDELRHDPLMAVLSGKLAARRGDCAQVAGKSTLNPLELSREEPSRYHKIAYDSAAIEVCP
jgi:DDE family transposase